MVWGSIIPAVASLAGGLMNRSSANDANDMQREMAGQSLQLQRDMAQHGIRWRVEDAKRAGIHPIFAMGANLPSASPVSVFPSQADNSFMGEVGSHLGRAIDATRTPEERQETRLEALTIRRAELENDLLESQILSERQRQMNPAFPSTRIPVSIRGFEEANSDLQKAGLASVDPRVELKPHEAVIADPGHNFQEPGTVTDVGWVRTPTGIAPVPSKDVKERIEDQFIPEAMWSLRNNLIPSFGGGKPPPLSWLPAGAESWRYSVTKQEWQPVYEGGRSYDQVVDPDTWHGPFGLKVRKERR